MQKTLLNSSVTYLISLNGVIHSSSSNPKEVTSCCRKFKQARADVKVLRVSVSRRGFGIVRPITQEEIAALERGEKIKLEEAYDISK